MYLVLTTATSRVSKLGLRSPMIPSAKVSLVGFATSSYGKKLKINLIENFLNEPFYIMNKTFMFHV